MSAAGGAKMPSIPDTGTGSMARARARTHAKPGGSTMPPGRHASASSPGATGRQSITSTMQTATPIGPSGRSVPHGRDAAQITSGPRYVVRRERSSMVFCPAAMSPAKG